MTDWGPEARPQSRETARSAPLCPEVVAAASERGITSIVHFTMKRGLVGILASGTVKSRQVLSEDEFLQYVYEANTPDRRFDKDWLDYVNLSLTNINLHMFDFSQRQHPEDAWMILEFGPEVLGDPGVVFSTTNNIYPAAYRCRGLRGFEQLFAPSVPGRYGDLSTREGRSPCQATDPQAEVLYPFELPLDHLHTITARDGETYDAAKAVRSTFDHRPKIELNPEAFR